MELGGHLVWAHADWRVVRVDDDDFPGFFRVVSNSHVNEMTDLGPAARARCMELVWNVEGTLRRELSPTKVNLAALGNLVPHLHWHVIARFDWDSHFPAPVWAARQREVTPAAVWRLRLGLPELDEAVAARLSEATSSSRTRRRR